MKPFLILFLQLFIKSASCQDTNNHSGYKCTASYGGIKDKGVLEIQKNTVLPLQLSLEDCNSNCDLVSFDLSVTRNGISYIFHSNSKNVSAEMRSLLRKLDHGSQILFSNIRYSVSGGGKSAIMHAISITIR
jgi:hypothetical protein